MRPAEGTVVAHVGVAGVAAPAAALAVPGRWVSGGTPAAARGSFVRSGPVVESVADVAAVAATAVAATAAAAAAAVVAVDGTGPAAGMVADGAAEAGVAEAGAVDTPTHTQCCPHLHWHH